MIELVASRGRVVLRLRALPMGPDLCVALGGGAEHVGAVAVAQPRPSLRGGEAGSATASVIALLGHKEDELARAVALRLAAALQVVVTVSCGIHLDDIAPAELADVEALAAELTQRLVEAARRAGGGPLPPTPA